MGIKMGYTREVNESHYDAMIRIASNFGLQRECEESFENEIKSGARPDEAVWRVLYDWDCLEIIE